MDLLSGALKAPAADLQCSSAISISRLSAGQAPRGGTGSRIKKSTPPEADKAENKFLRINPLFFCLDTKESKNQAHQRRVKLKINS